jgi:HEAT repeat protein
LIYKSQTACYAKDRRDAIHKLGDNYDCTCSPEIMTAFIYALNDADERVRAKAADEIGDQLEKNRCCCSREVVAALTAALGDCDKRVRREAEQALEACGYDVVKGCCQGVSCDPCACNYGGPRPCVNGGVPPVPAGKDPKAAPPAPGTEKVYLPAKLRFDRPKSRARLANLFGLLN